MAAHCLLGESAGAGRVTRYDIQLKGSGPTPYSRGGDGRSPLGPVLRESTWSARPCTRWACPATRALAAVTTGEPVTRDSVLPGAVLARVAASHIRIGTLPVFCRTQGPARPCRAMVATYCRAATLPRSRPAKAENPALALLQAVIRSPGQPWYRAGNCWGSSTG